jgi:hypothetical protein
MNKPSFSSIAKTLDAHGRREGTGLQLDATSEMLEKALSFLTPEEARLVLAAPANEVHGLTKLMLNKAPKGNLITEIAASVIEWEQIGEKGKRLSRLLGDTAICGINFHIEAIQVNSSGQAVGDDGGTTLERLQAVDPDADFATIKIGKLDYVVFLIPFDK